MSKNQEKIKAALNRIEDSLQAINTDKDWINFLCFQAQFYNYSFGNAMLIYKVSTHLLRSRNVRLSIKRNCIHLFRLDADAGLVVMHKNRMEEKYKNLLKST